MLASGQDMATPLTTLQQLDKDGAHKPPPPFPEEPLVVNY